MLVFFIIAIVVLGGILTWIFQPVIKSWSHKKIEYEVFDQSTLERKKRTGEQIYLSIVFPAYNEENRLRKTLDLTFQFLFEWSKRKAFTFEAIVVNDGSKDATAAIAKEYYEKYPEVFRLVSLKKNRGKGAAMKVGVAEAKGKYVLMADADGATEIEDAEALLSRMLKLEEKFHDEKVGIVVGSREYDRAHLAEKSVSSRAFYRTILMKGFHVLVMILCTRNIQDTQCGFKLFTNHVAKVLFENLHLNRWAFDIELIFQAEALGYHMDEVSVNWKEVEGSKLIQTKLDIVTTSLTMARDMLAVRLAYLFGLWKLPRGHYATDSKEL